MNRVFLIIFTFFMLNLHAEDKPVVVKKVQGSKELPQELNLILDVLQNQKETSKIDETREQILPTVKSIDKFAQLLNKEDIFLIGKIEIYKTLLKSNETFANADLNIETVNKLRTALKKATDPFVKWFIEALINDTEALIARSDFKEYLLQKANGRLERIEHKRIEKKVQLLYRWISKINPSSHEFQNMLKADLAPVLLEALKNIEQTFYMMSTLNLDKTKVASGDLKYFSVQEIKLTKPAPKKEKSVEDILAPLTDEDKMPQPLPTPSEEDWLDNDNSPANLKNLPKPSNDADWLQDI